MVPGFRGEGAGSVRVVDEVDSGLGCDYGLTEE